MDELRGRARTTGLAGAASPFSPAAVAAARVSARDLTAARGSLYWVESRPWEGGRQVVVRWRPGSPARDVSPPGTSVRSRVHEYGGGAFACRDGVLVVVDASDQHVYRLDGEGARARRSRCSPEPPLPGRQRRYGDLQPDGPVGWVVAVEEEHELTRVRHRLVALATDGRPRRCVLVDDGSFVAAPRPSPDGSLLAWVTWRHPDLPWDRSALVVGRLGRDDAGDPVLTDAAAVADDPGSSVGQPRWRPDGSLSWMWDRSGWWLPYAAALTGVGRGAGSAGTVLAGTPVPMVPTGTAAEFHAPDWALGQRTAVDLADGSVVCRMRAEGADRLVRLVPEDRPRPGGPPRARGRPPSTWRLELVAQPFVAVEGVAHLEGDEVGVLGATAEEGGLVAVVSVAGGERARVARQPPAPWVPSDVSPWRSVVVDGPAGALPGLFYPARPGSGPGDPPPLVVFCHGGPTGGVDPGFDPLVQACTGRGLAVAAVDYRGSSGHGRAYRHELRHAWGVVDAEDCAAFARALAGRGWVDGRRMAVRGTSAGGFTALRALARDDCFRGAVVWYGVTDLEALAAETHDFESHYVDWLVGPLVTHRARYEERSPLRHPEELRGSVLLLQGTEDPVVPTAHVRAFARRAADAGVDVRLLELAGEGHGFRRADSLEQCVAAELDFYGEVLGTGPERAAGAPSGRGPRGRVDRGERR
ncbi:MAG: prolyl oligopeptidase family serine peptidase [Actinomycetota bacterium]|nr:prolyl oligopeptidase family serine peptidase [Actinomycetota bacterium]